MPGPEEKSASLTDWIAVFAGALGALMASLDISITNSALPQIQGEIGASGTEGTWISTGYLVAEVVIIPLTAWLTRVLGMRTLLLGCAVTFTAFSILCGFSHDLTTMIIGRVGQGFTGGALIPTAQIIIRTRLPLRQLPVGMTIFGVIVLTGPLLGPIVGGWLTENATWQWCFFLNLPICALLSALLIFGLPHERSNPDLFLNADWLGIAGLTAFLSCLTVVLEEGQRERWFESDLINMLTAAGVIGFIMLMVAQATARAPVVKLRLLLNKNYASIIVMVIAVGTVLYGVLYILPQFLSIIAGYNAQQSGGILFISGVPAFLVLPILPLLLARADIRAMLAVGILCFAASCMLDIGLTADSNGDDFVWSQLLRGLGQMLSMMPLNQASVGAVAREDIPDAAGLFNMARNLGGSLGLAALGVFIDRRTELHSDAIRESVTANSPLAQERIAGMAANLMQNGGDIAHAQMMALAQLSAQIHRQALVITYSDCFSVLTVALLATLPLIFILRPPPKNRPVSTEAH